MRKSSAKVKGKKRRQVSQARANVYRFLASLYNTPPSRELLARMKGEGFADHLRVVFGPKADSLIGYLEGFGADEGDWEALRLEYDALFRVPGPRYVRPYEAVYRDKRGLVWGKPTVAVKGLYRRAGADISEDFMELPDFIGLELEFMGFLCSREGEAWQEGDEDSALKYLALQREFLEGHLGQWVAEFCQEMLEKAESGFYRGLAEMTREYVLEDEERVQGSLPQRGEG